MARPVIKLSKQVRELRAFKAAAEALHWKVSPDSIQQPAPPEPDVLCIVEGLGPVAVELLSLDDQPTNKRKAFARETPEAWEGVLSRWPEVEQGQLRDDTRNAYITANFAEDLGAKDRAEVFHAIQTLLLGLPGFKGKITAESLKNPEGFESAQVGRYEDINDGPRFYAPSVYPWSEAQVDKIVEQLTDKAYTPKAPMDLFAYSVHHAPDGALGSLEKIQAAVAEHLPGSQFRRVHLFNLGLRQHICSMP
jgi:hypothetical protein